MTTRTGVQTSAQISKMGAIELCEAGFSLPNKEAFLIKNESATPVELDVALTLNDEWITTTFYPGWNPELVRSVKCEHVNVNLKFGI